MKLLVIGVIGIVLAFINLILFMKGFSVKGKALQIFSVYLFFSFLMLVLHFGYWYYGIENLYQSHFQFFMQYVCLSLFYKQILSGKSQLKLLNRLLYAVPILLLIQYAVSPSLFFKHNLLEIVLTNLILAAYSVMNFYNGLNNKLKYPYINTGIFMYLTSSTLIFCAGNFITISNATLKMLPWVINASLYLIFQMLILVEGIQLNYNDDNNG